VPVSIARLLAVFGTVGAREGRAVTGCFREKFLSRRIGPMGPYVAAYVLLHGV